MDTHLKYLLIVFIMSVTFMCINLNCKEHFYIDVLIKKPVRKPSSNKLFNIDNEIDRTPGRLGWKSFWRNNYSTYDDNLEKVFKDPEHTPFKTPLLYDGVRSPNCV